MRPKQVRVKGRESGGWRMRGRAGAGQPGKAAKDGQPGEGKGKHAEETTAQGTERDKKALEGQHRQPKATKNARAKQREAGGGVPACFCKVVFASFFLSLGYLVLCLCLATKEGPTPGQRIERGKQMPKRPTWSKGS